ncbi:MAG TPA: protein kinase [Blastocatellia bacterium]|nr:protein kinase [Blastocatellia bacterium]
MIGSVVGNYKIVDKLGEGGMGSVFKGVDLMLEREVAIKMLRPELASQANVVERFRSEAVTLAKLNHPNVATLHSFFRQGNDFFMVMEFVRGETLDAVIKRQGAMPCDRAVELFCHALEGIDHAHKMGIVHRDIKPANMMLTDSGSIKVMDFGIARVLGTDRLTRAGHLIGTVEYMSPEQVRGEETDARSDIYSLGILLYEMLTGRVPFNSTSEYELMRSQIEDAPTPPRTFAPHIPLPVEQAIMRSLAKKREARYQSAADMRGALTNGITAAFAVTQPRPGVYAAPATVLDIPVGTPSSGEIKGTRLAADAGELKGTRLGAGDVMTAYAQAAPAYYPSGQAAAQAAPSFLSKLNWKHYAGAGAALVVLIALPLVLLGGGGKPTKPATVTQPVTPTQTDSAPAQPPQQAVEVPSQLGAPISAGSQSNNANAGGDSSGGKSARSRNSGAAQAGDASAGDRSSGDKASSGESQREKGSASKREQRSDSGRDVAKKEVRKEEKKTDGKDKASKIGDAANAVGGAVNKIKGLFGKKKND